MARGRRRSTRSTAQDTPDDTAAEDTTETPPESVDQTDSQPAHKDEDKCPACTEETTQDWDAADKESWVRCDACKRWFHWRCAGEGDLETVGKWYAWLQSAPSEC